MKAQRAFNIFQTIEIIIAIIIIGLLIIPQLLGYKLYVVKTGSMEPTIKAHSLVYVQTNFNCNDINVNDIIAFKFSNDELVTHRVVKKSANTFVTKGDANTAQDPQPVKFSNVIGITKHTIPYIGKMFLYMQTTLAKVILIILLIFNVLADILIRFINKSKKVKNQI